MGETQKKWIRPASWTPELREESYLIRFRKELEMTELPESLLLTVSADSRYKLYINGSLVHFGPCKGDDTCRYADTLELRLFLKPGKNVLAAELLCVGSDPWNSNHSLFTAGLHALYVEGIEPDGWRCHICRSVAFPAEEEGFAPLHIHEIVSADPACAGWQEADFDDSSWEPALACPISEVPTYLQGENLRPRRIPCAQLRPHRFALPVQAIPPHSTQSFVLDAGEEMTGFLRLAMSGGRGADIELLESECYVTADGKRNRLDSVNGHLEGYRDTYTVGGFPGETYEPYWFRTFRFIKVTVRTKDEVLTLHSFDYEETGYPLEVRTSVATSDSTLAPIWDISLRTLRRCMHDTYMDGPFYEQLSYIMDTRSQILYTYAISADDRLARQSIDDFSRSQRPDGLLNACYPNKNANVIPGFSIYFILMLHDHMMYFGDRQLIRTYLPTVERILHFFHTHRTESGLADKVGGVNLKAPRWSFIDWAAEWMPTMGMPTAGLYGPLTTESLLLVYGLQKASELADYVEEADLAHEYRERAVAMQAAIRACCMDHDGMLTDGPGRPERSQHAQVFGILTDTLTAEEGRRNLLRTLEDRNIPQCTVAMCFYLFRALEKVGLYEYTDQYWEIWRTMIRNGCTTCVEAADYSRSECHAWGALALYELPSVILGVRPVAPGYEKILVRPTPGYLTSASGLVHTPKGDLQVAWEKTNGGLALSIRGDEEVKKRITAE